MKTHFGLKAKKKNCVFKNFKPREGAYLTRKCSSFHIL